MTETGEAEGRSAARLATWAFAGLALATVAAFFLSSILKSQPSVLEDIERIRFFSPNGDGFNDVQVVRFRMDESDEISVDVVDVEGNRMQRVLADRDVERGERVTVRWDGRDEDGEVAPDGEYQIRVILNNEGRAILAPRPFELDTKPPSPAVVVDEDDATIRPGGEVPFVVRRVPPENAPSFAVLRTDGPGDPEVVRRFEGAAGVTEYSWNGRDDAGAPVPQGTYLIRVTAADLAGNEVSLPDLTAGAAAIAGRPGVSVRELTVQPPVTPARSGGGAGFTVDAGGRPYTYALRRVGDDEVLRKGRKKRAGLIVDLPFGPSGVHVLTVRAGDDVTRVPLMVQARERKDLLLVAPVIDWLGQDPVDANGDGLPDTFATRSTVTFPRPFAFPGGLPPGFTREVAPLLRFLDEAGYKYDLTTDLALRRDEEPAASRTGVLFLGNPRYTSPATAARLREYVRGGGRVATFGPGALTASVRIGERRLFNPAPPTPDDALGGRLGRVRAVDPAVALTVLQDGELLTGFAGTLPGFSSVEELDDPGGEVLASVGAESTALKPAFSAVRDGEGLALRVGLPEWTAKLAAGDDNVRQLTYNLIDVLRDATPRVRGAN